MSESKRVLAIDPGTLCGWALQDGAQRYSGTWNLKPTRSDGGGMRYVRLKRCLGEIGRVDLVVYEEVKHHKGTEASHIYGGIELALTGWCEEQNPKIPYTAVPVGTIKKHATGKGNADKDTMIAAFTKRNGYAPFDDNEADAWFLLDYAMREVVPAKG